SSPAQKLFNAEVDKVLHDVHLAKTGGDVDRTDDFAMTLGHASPSLVSARLSILQENLAHPTPYEHVINIDMRRGKLLSFADAFEAKALAALVERCDAQLHDAMAQADADFADATARDANR